MLSTPCMLKGFTSSASGLVIAWVRAVSTSPEADTASMKPFQTFSSVSLADPDLRRRSSVKPALCLSVSSLLGALGLRRVAPLPLRPPRSVPNYWPTYLSGLSRSLSCSPSPTHVWKRFSCGPGPILSISAQSIGHGLSSGLWIRDCCGGSVLELRGCGLLDPSSFEMVLGGLSGL